MIDEEETVGTSTDKSPRKSRLRGAISRTKSKFKKSGGNSQDDEFTLPNDVNQFLQAGRPAASESYNADALPAHPSPRRVQVPRIDVSTSQRWPDQREVNLEKENTFLVPEHQPRSMSQGALRPRRKRSRNLSVSFIDAPPVIIGEGGDEAETPPIEISRPRARSVSPMPYSRAKPRRRQDSMDEPAPGRPLARVQTGMQHSIRLGSNRDVDREFETSLQPGPASIPRKLEKKPAAHFPDNLRSYRKPTESLNDPRTQFEEGRALPGGLQPDISNSSFVVDNSAVQPNARQPKPLSLGDRGITPRNPTDIILPTRPHSGQKEQNPSGWI